MTGKLFLVLILTLLGLPVIVPVMLMTFWIKCALIAGHNLHDALIEGVDPVDDAEPPYMLEAMEDFKKRSRAEAAKKYPMSTPDDPNCDYIDR